MTIFEELREDHDKQRTLVDLLCKTHGDSDGRHELFARLKDAMERHAAAEERYFYSPLLKHDRSQDRARHSVAEHQELDELLDRLDDTRMDSSAFLAHARTLHERLTHHLDKEEHEVFQIAGKSLSDEQKSHLAQGYREHMQEQRDA